MSPTGQAFLLLVENWKLQEHRPHPPTLCLDLPGVQGLRTEPHLILTGNSHWESRGESWDRHRVDERTKRGGEDKGEI